MKRKALYFTLPGQVEVIEENLKGPAPDEALVHSRYSAISPGTEMLVYRGQFPDGMPVDATIKGLGQRLTYPLKYGYSLVGQVVAVGSAVDPAWKGRSVFSFHPHEEYFNAKLKELVPVPEGIDLRDAVFLPNMETAVNFAMDGRPMIGEAVGVFGLGIVGLLTMSVLAQFPLESLVGFDLIASRRKLAAAAGAHKVVNPGDEDDLIALQASLPAGGFDLVYELSGAPQALDTAISVTGFTGRVVIGSWYGKKTAHLNLGGHFHRSRIKLISSQVSTISPEWMGRWTSARRLEEAWRQIDRLRPSRWITNIAAFADAQAIYRQVDKHPDTTLQMVFAY